MKLVGSLFVVPLLLFATVPPAVSGAGEAGFHLQLTRSLPAAEATLSAPPDTLRLWFNQTPQLSATSVRLVGPGDELVETGSPSFADHEETQVRVPVKGTVPSGTSRVVWRTLARDGHVVNGEFAFRVD